MQDRERARFVFIALWVLVTVTKVALAARLPLFVDEAFYWQEGRHLAWAYSELPALTAWLARLGTEWFGTHVLALRSPFLLIAALLPWLVVRTASRWFGDVAGWQAGSLAVLMPLTGTLGLLALPDVPMALATVLCLMGGAGLLREVRIGSLALLAAGLVLGALSHYRFVGVIGVGLLALLWLPEGRRLLRDARVWVVLGIGAAAWWPLLWWNLQHADAGLRFQLVDRHPWSFQIGGLWFVLIQTALVTPLLFLAFMQVSLRALRGDAAQSVQWRYFALLGSLSTLGFFVLGFFADSERVSFHWPLPGYLALLVVVPLSLRGWSRRLRMATWWVAGVGLALALGYYAWLSTPVWRAQAAAEKYYLANFSGWDELAHAVREELAQAPADTRVLAGSFKIGAELGFQLDDPGIAVLDHPLNHRHGRAPQLRLWGLESDGSRTSPTLLVVADNEVKYRDLLVYYRDLCAKVGPLPPPRVVNVDHGRQRFLLFHLPAERGTGECVLPAFAWIDTPEVDAHVENRLRISGWAFKDGAGLERVEILLGGKPVAEATYGGADPGVAAFWKISIDPQHPNVRFDAEIDVSGLAPGRHWFGLRLHGRDGSVEDWPEQPVRIVQGKR